MLKRIVDLCFCFILLPLVLPLFILIAILIKLDSHGPIFYIGIRTGQYSKLFGIYKFRTMTINADEGEGTTGLNDPRVTKIGRVLRHYKIDELPQFLNVLKGEMSIVGPRPELPRYTDAFSEDQKLILTVKPGITDYSSMIFANLNEQVGSHEPEKIFEQKILPLKNKLRMQYIKEQSFLVDMKIIFKTMTIVFMRLFSKVI